MGHPASHSRDPAQWGNLSAAPTAPHRTRARRCFDTMSAVPSRLLADRFLVAAEGPLWDRFLTSAGFGGLMAFVAACVAGYFVTRQIRHSKEQQSENLRHSREQQSENRWWDLLTWVYDRTIVEKDKRQALPYRAAVSILASLDQYTQSKEGGDPLQSHSIAAINKLFNERLRDEASSSEVPDEVRDPDSPGIPSESTADEQASQGPSPDPVALELSNELQRDLDARGFRAQTTREAFAFGEQVRQAVARIVASIPGAVQVFPYLDNGPDFIVVINEYSVLIHVKATSEESFRYVYLAPAIERVLGWSSHPLSLHIFVLNKPVSAKDSARVEKDFKARGVRIVVWRDPGDDNDLSDAVRAARPS